MPAAQSNMIPVAPVIIIITRHLLQVKVGFSPNAHTREAHLPDIFP
jgi:hypothetical protein